MTIWGVGQFVPKSVFFQKNSSDVWGSWPPLPPLDRLVITNAILFFLSFSLHRSKSWRWTSVSERTVRSTRLVFTVVFSGWSRSVGGADGGRGVTEFRCRAIVATVAAVTTGTVVTTSAVIIVVSSVLAVSGQRGHDARRTAVLHTQRGYSRQYTSEQFEYISQSINQSCKMCSDWPLSDHATETYKLICALSESVFFDPVKRPKFPTQ